MKKKKIGIIGCGTIGSELARRIVANLSEQASVSYVSETEVVAIDALKADLSPKRFKVVSIDELITNSDFVVETASASISGEVVKKCLRKNKDVMVLSIGGILPIFEDVEKLANKSSANVYLPSGAVCGLDGILAARGGGLKKVTLTTRKPLNGLKGAPYFEKQGIDLGEIKKETVVFNGKARDAIKYFPKNVNVAAALSLAGLGSNKTIVQIVTSPNYKSNSHEICAEGDFGKIITRTENVPSPTNPKTSFMAILSAESLLNKICSSIKVGG